jgi:hypothetical protein
MKSAVFLFLPIEAQIFSRMNPVTIDAMMLPARRGATGTKQLAMNIVAMVALPAATAAKSIFPGFASA